MAESIPEKDQFLTAYPNYVLRETVTYPNGGVSRFYDDGVDMVIIDDKICSCRDGEQIFPYTLITDKQNHYMKIYRRVFRFLGFDPETIEKCLRKSRQEVLHSTKKISERGEYADSSPLELLFEQNFTDVYGMRALKYLQKEFRISDEDGNNYFLDYLVDTADSRVAIEENGIHYHHPQLIGIEGYRKQLRKQNTCALWGLKLYRFSTEDCRFKDRIEDDIRSYLGKDTGGFREAGLLLERKTELYEHQEISLAQIEERREKGIRAFLIVLPTAAGKSRIVEEDIQKFAAGKEQFRVLILAPNTNIIADWKERIDKDLQPLQDRIDIKTYSYAVRHYHEKTRDYYSYIVVDGYEFMVAPYAMAHMKIAMKLKETGYEFPANSRLQVFLANSLIEGKHIVENKDDPLEIENALAESVRKDSKINVVIGSPPFHADSKNQNEWIMALMEDYKKEPGSTERLREKNPKLINDDYVKFIRLAEDIVKNQDNAVIAYIIPFSYASNLTFRGMRWNLLKQFSEIYILDLHGNVMGRDAADSAERDENILDIQLGVCVSFFIKKKDDNTDSAKVFYSDFSGSRERKYQFLLNAKFGDIQWTTVNPVEPYYFFKPVDLSQADEYNTGISLADLFPAYLGGVKTHDDGNLISFTSFNTGCDYLYDYRPFDIRHINYDRRKVSRDRYDIMRHMIGHENYGLVIDRQVVTDNWSHIQIVRHMIDNRLHYSNRGIPVLCPMYLYEDGKAKPNVNSEMVSMITEKTGISFSESLVESETEFDIMDLFDYSYGILNSPLYIEKYIDLLKIEFPKVPIPNGNEMFWRIVAYGRRLRKLHLLEEDIGNPMGISFEGVGDNIVSSRKLKPEGLYINRTQLFTNVTEEIWDFCYGGYHGLQKWFKDRNGMKLSEDDIQHVIRVLNVFEKTISIREDLDICMDEFGLI